MQNNNIEGGIMKTKASQDQMDHRKQLIREYILNHVYDGSQRNKLVKYVATRNSLNNNQVRWALRKMEWANEIEDILNEKAKILAEQAKPVNPIHTRNKKRSMKECRKVITQYFLEGKGENKKKADIIVELMPIMNANYYQVEHWMRLMIADHTLIGERKPGIGPGRYYHLADKPVKPEVEQQGKTTNKDVKTSVDEELVSVQQNDPNTITITININLERGE